MGISQFIKDKAMELGFSACGIAEVAKAGSEEAPHRAFRSGTRRLILTNGSRKATMLE